ncbi:MAG: flagellar assembly protein FliH [Holophagaceae bacterium]|nr:flagellar assembly protein FliH [Holophagaceae bacterium]
MSLDARYIPAKDIDVNRIQSYPYQTAIVLPTIEEILPDSDGEDPLGEPYSETPEEVEERLKTANQVIAEKLAHAEHLIAERLAQTEKLVAEKLAEVAEKYSQAEIDAVETTQRAYEAGYATGEKEGRISEESQYKIHLKRLESSLGELSDSVTLLKNASEDEVVALVTVMAEYLAAQHIETADNSASLLLASIISAHPFPLPESASPGEPAAVLYMHPRDVEQVQDSFATSYPGLRLVADNNLSRGSIKLETADTVLDATFDKRRERLLTIVTRLMEEGQL